MTRTDIVVILLLAGVIGATAMLQWRDRGPATAVVVHRGAERVAVHPLDQPGVFDFDGRIGVSRIEIARGRARFLSSPCRNQVCVHAGWQTRSGAVAACVPNGLSLQLVGGEREFDGYAG